MAWGQWLRPGSQGRWCRWKTLRLLEKPSSGDGRMESRWGVGERDSGGASDSGLV